jgi:magnesium chelatase subunit D
LRGRPLGTRRGQLRPGLRLHVPDTLRAAAPWQRLRGPARAGEMPPSGRRLEIRKDDFHIARIKQRTQTTTIFVVDASGSAAAQRMAEAKGAVELLLADCYVRRDQVALVAFRGGGAEVLLAPTRSLTRAKRALAGLPAGGGTPLAAGIDTASRLVEQALRRGETPIVVALTDGRANVARDGIGGRQRAAEDALAAARRFRGLAVAAMVIDIAARPDPQGAELARAMGAAYLPLPRADAQAVSRAVRGVAGGRSARRAS